MKFENKFIHHVVEGQKLYLLIINVIHVNETDILRTEINVEEVKVTKVDFDKNIISVKKEKPSSFTIMLDADGRTENFYDGSQAFLEKPILPELPQRDLRGRKVYCSIMGQGYIYGNDEKIIIAEFACGKRIYDYQGCMRIYSNGIEKYLKDSTLSIIT